jgi:hypothetical protein
MLHASSWRTFRSIHASLGVMRREPGYEVAHEAQRLESGQVIKPCIQIASHLSIWGRGCIECVLLISLKALLHDAIFLATCNAILLFRDAKLASTIACQPIRIGNFEKS